jgi:hypothetical protein
MSLKIDTRRKDDFHASAPDLRIGTGTSVLPDSPLSAKTLKSQYSPNSPTLNRKLKHLEKLHKYYEDLIRRQMKASVT